MPEKIIFASEMTRLEVLGYHKISSLEEAAITRFFENIEMLDISKDVIRMALEFRKSQHIGAGDAIIGATAVLNKLTIYTANISDFTRIGGAKISNPLDT